MSSQEKKKKEYSGGNNSSMSSQRKKNRSNKSSDGKNNKKKEEEQPQKDEKWWNEWPLEGDPNRPAVIYTNMMSKSPRLFGWDDEEMEKKCLEILDENNVPTYVEDPNQKELMVHITVSPLLDWISEAVEKRLIQLAEETEIKVDDETPPLKPIEAFETEDEESLRDSNLYKGTLRMLRWQRDNYLVGRRYADQRKVEREIEADLNKTGVFPKQPMYMTTMKRIPFDATALGNIQLTKLGQWFIPSRTVHRALLPIALGLPRGPLYSPAFNATTNLIYMSQNQIDRVMKQAVLGVLQDAHWHEVIKNSTNGYIATTYRDSPGSPGKKNTS